MAKAGRLHRRRVKTAGGARRSLFDNTPPSKAVGGRRVNLVTVARPDVKDLLRQLARDAPDREVPVSRYVRGMEERGYTAESAVLLLQELVRDGDYRLTNKYTLLEA